MDESSGQMKVVKQKCTDESRETCVRSLREAMRLGLSKVWGDARTSHHLGSTFLDPRFKQLTSWGLADEEEEEEVVRKFVDEMTTMVYDKTTDITVSLGLDVYMRMVMMA